MKSVKINVPIYPFEFMVSVNQTNKQIMSDFVKYWDEKDCLDLVRKDVEDSDTNWQAYFKMYDCQIGIFRFKKKPSLEVIVHECFHACHKLMSRIGQTLSDDSEESYAYLMDYIFEQVYAAII